MNLPLCPWILTSTGTSDAFGLLSMVVVELASPQEGKVAAVLRGAHKHSNHKLENNMVQSREMMETFGPSMPKTFAKPQRVGVLEFAALASGCGVYGIAASSLLPERACIDEPPAKKPRNSLK